MQSVSNRSNEFSASVQFVGLQNGFPSVMPALTPLLVSWFFPTSNRQLRHFTKLSGFCAVEAKPYSSSSASHHSTCGLQSPSIVSPDIAVCFIRSCFRLGSQSTGPLSWVQGGGAVQNGFPSVDVRTLVLRGFEKAALHPLG